MIDRCLLPGLAIAFFVVTCAASAPAAAAELWRDSPRKKDCQLELVNEIGGVLINASLREGSAAAVHGDPELVIEASAGSGHPLLAVARSNAAREIPADVEVSVPRDCTVEVRTVDGTVHLDLGNPAFLVDIITVTGDIVACIDPDASAIIRFATSGEITTDFTIEIDHKYHVEPAKHGDITLKSGEWAASEPSVVHLGSRRGAVSMLMCTGNNKAQQPEMPVGKPAK